MTLKSYIKGFCNIAESSFIYEVMFFVILCVVHLIVSLAAIDVVYLSSALYNFTNEEFSSSASGFRRPIFPPVGFLL